VGERREEGKEGKGKEREGEEGEGEGERFEREGAKRRKGKGKREGGRKKGGGIQRREKGKGKEELVPAQNFEPSVIFEVSLNGLWNDTRPRIMAYMQLLVTPTCQCH
jgi:hypothetical protein